MTVKICTIFWILATLACLSWTLKQDSLSHVERETRDSDQVCSEGRCGKYSRERVRKEHKCVDTYFAGELLNLAIYTCKTYTSNELWFVSANYLECRSFKKLIWCITYSYDSDWKYDYSDILKRFPGIFFTKRQYTVTLSNFKAVREEFLRKQHAMISKEDLGDGDSCCPTEVQSFINYTMTNIYGENRRIIHMPPKYQFVPHGSCLETKTNKCKGTCVVEPIILHLLTYNSGTGELEFDQFVVPGYCSCKNISI